MKCRSCGGSVRSQSKEDMCHKCRGICSCGRKKWVYSKTCNECRKNDKDGRIRASLTWYLTDAEKDEQVVRIRGGMCKFGCGRPAGYPVKGEFKDRCEESSNSCPEVVRKSSDGLKRHWDGLSVDDRKNRSQLAGGKIRAWRKDLSKGEVDRQWKKRSQNKEWKRKLSDARKSLIERGLAANLNGCGFSKACRDFCAELVKRFSDDEVYFDGHGGERVFPGGFRADFLNRTKKFIVEFNGDFWHCNPKMWAEERYNRAIRMTAGSKWKYDTKRHKIFKSCGYDVFVVWESDWIADREKCLNGVVDKIKEGV